MAINAIFVTQIPINDKAETGASAPVSAVKIYQASMLAAKNNAVEAGFANDGTTSIPTPGTAYNADWPDLKAGNPLPNKIGSGALYQITVPFTEQSIASGGTEAISPLLRDPVYNENGQPTTFEADRDVDGNLLVNASGQVLTVPVQHADLYISATVNNASNLDWTDYFTRVNTSSYTLNGKSYAPMAVLLSHVDKIYTEEEFDGEVLQFYQYTFHFYIRFARGAGDPSTWQFKILNQGTVEKKTAPATGTDAIIDDNGNIITEPVNLDADGKKLDPGATPYWLNQGLFSTSADARMDMYQDTAFSSLPV